MDSISPARRRSSRPRRISVYDETANASATQNVKNGGGMFDIGGGYRTNRYGIGISYTQFKSTNSASISGSIPHPLFFDRPRTVSATLDGLEHTEHVVHVQAYYFVPGRRGRWTSACSSARRSSASRRTT